VPMIY